jgi:hypothetical protein
MIDFDDYITTCPICGDSLNIVSFDFFGKIPLRPSGFSTDEASEFNSRDEIVECDSCGFRINGLPLGTNWLISVSPYIGPDWNDYMPVLRFKIAPVDDRTNAVDYDSTIVIFDIRLWFTNKGETKLTSLALTLAREHAQRIGAGEPIIEEVVPKND